LFYRANFSLLRAAHLAEVVLDNVRVLGRVFQKPASCRDRFPAL
jgi:hypothetical protein